MMTCRTSSRSGSCSSRRCSATSAPRTYMPMSSDPSSRPGGKAWTASGGPSSPAPASTPGGTRSTAPRLRQRPKISSAPWSPVSWRGGSFQRSRSLGAQLERRPSSSILATTTRTRRRRRSTKAGGAVRVRDGHRVGSRGRVPVPVGGGGLLHRLPAALPARLDVRLLLPCSRAGVVEAAVPGQRAHQPQRRPGPEQALDVRPARRRRLPGTLPAPLRLPRRRRLHAPVHVLRLLRLRRPLRLPGPLLRHPAAALLLPRRRRRPALPQHGCLRGRARVVGAAAPGRGVGGEARAGGGGATDVVERAEVLGAQRRDGPALRLRQRPPGARRRRHHRLRADEQGVRREAVPGRRVRLHRLLRAAAPGHDAQRAQRRRAGWRDLEQRGQRQRQRRWLPFRRRVPAALPLVLRCGVELPLARGHVSPAGRCKGSCTDYRGVRSHRRCDAGHVWLGAHSSCLLEQRGLI